MSRILSWFSCGAASAVATKLAIEANRGKVDVIRCWVKEEHPDNERFHDECEEWFGVKIRTVRNAKYNGSVDEVIRKKRRIVAPEGAPCTSVLKKDLRKLLQLPGDLHVFGYTVEEQDRLDSFIDANNDALVWPVLIEAGLSHSDCLAMLKRAGIELPTMYKLGYKHNNCIGCVKGGAGYWNKIRVDFPERYAQMARNERNLGISIIRLQKNGVKERVFLDELPLDAGRYQDEPEIQCGINCELVIANGYKHDN